MNDLKPKLIEEYWLKKLSGELTTIRLPLKKTLKKKTMVESLKKQVQVTIPGITSANLKKICKNSEISLFIFFLSGLNIILNRYTGIRDLVIGTLNPRKKARNGEIILCRNRVPGQVTFKEFINQVKEVVLEAFYYGDYLFDDLFQKLPLQNRHEAVDIFNIAFIYNPFQVRSQSLDRFELLFILSGIDNQLVLTIEFVESIYSRELVQRFGKNLTNLFENITEKLEQEIEDIDILNLHERQELLDFNKISESGAKDTGSEQYSTINEAFINQVKKTPDRVALVSEDRMITYRELDERVKRAARVLRDRGVKPDRIVGVLLDRSIEMIVGMLGVLRAGGGYLPIDPETPISRIVSMLKDCQASVLLTDSGIVGKYPFSSLQELQVVKTRPMVTSPRPQITQLDDLPFIDRSLVDYEKYNKYIGLAAVKDSIVLMGTRGCPYKCAYCHKIWPKKHIVRSAENIFKEIQDLYNMGVRRFVLIDDIFNLNVENSTRFFELIIKNGLEVQLFFPNGLRGELLTKDYIDLLIEAGTVNISLSLETASPRLQKLIKKNLNIEKLRENIEYLCKKHPQVILDVQTMHGFPTETEEEAMMTLEFIKSMKWLHFPYVHMVKIYPNTDMEKLAVENGISREVIARSANLGYHELAETLPFARNFSLRYQSEFLNDYFLAKERLLHVLPYQMKILTEDEMVQKYNAYLATDIRCFADILTVAGISEDELETGGFPDDNYMFVPDINDRMKKYFPARRPAENALKLLILDLTTFFSDEVDVFYDMIEPPLGPMAVLTYLNRQFGDKIHGKIAKSRLDFDNYGELKALLEEFKPDIIGVRALTYYKNFFHQTTAMIRHWGISVPIIAGGPYATSDYETILQDRNVDLVVLGEGEITFSELMEKIIENEGTLPEEGILKEIPGIAYIPGTGNTGSERRLARDIIMLDALGEISPAGPVEGPERINGPSDLAYSIFTSGSTGKPKGTLTSHANVLRVVKNTNYIHIDENDRLLQLSNYSFDGSVFDIYGALLNGAALVMMNKQEVFDLERLAELIDKDKITVFFVTTALFNTLVEFKLEFLKNIRKVLFGGEMVSVEHTGKSVEFLGKERVIHMYGPTETTVYAAYHNVNEVNENMGTIPIGSAISDTALFILDNRREFVPIGVTGEIYIGGGAVARGYLNNPELTHRKFIFAPSVDSNVLYKTGDLGRWVIGENNGNIEFIGRIDHQVKIRGFRIEPEEIKSHLLNHRDIIDAVVIVREKRRANNDAGKGEKYLYAYVVPDNDGVMDYNVPELREYLSRELPDFMMPNFIIPLERLPLTANGKIDRDALPDPDVSADDEYKPPANEIEKKLAVIWGELLGIEQDKISVNADFFLLGGHSLLATSLVSRIHKEFDVKVSLRKVFETPEIRGLAQHIKHTKKTRYLTLKWAEKRSYYPLSSAQKRLYFLQLLDIESMNYNMPMIMRLEGELDGKKLEKAFLTLIERHESPRTSFRMISGQPVQIIHDEVDFKLECYEADSGKSSEYRKTGTMEKSFFTPFDPGKAPLLKVGLIKIEEENHIFLMDMHHIISDGISLHIFLNEFMKAYQGEELPGLKFQYKDYSQWQNREQHREAMEKQEAYWLSQFKGEIPELNLPIDYERVPNQVREGSEYRVVLSTEETMALKRLAQEKEVTMYMVLLAIFNVLLSKLSNREDIIVGTPVAGREHPDLQHIMGMFVNTLALRNYPVRQKTFEEFLLEVKTRTIDAFENQSYQLETLVEKTAANRAGNRNPLFEVLFELQDIRMMKVEIPGLKLIPCECDVRIAKFDLTLTGAETDRDLSLNVEYNTKLFKQETIKKIIVSYRNIIDAVVKSPRVKISDIEIIGEAEKKELEEKIREEEMVVIEPGREKPPEIEADFDIS